MFTAYVDNIGRIGEFPSKSAAIRAIRDFNESMLISTGRIADHFNRKVSCPNAHYLGVHNKLCAKRGDMLIYEQDNNHRTARVMGRIATVDSDGEDCKGWLSVLVLSQDGYSLYVRWINPAWVRAIFDPPKKVPAFFFSAEWPDNDKPAYASEQGSLHEFYISNV